MPTATQHSRGPVHSYPTRNYSYFMGSPAPLPSCELRALPDQMPVLSSYLEIDKLVRRTRTSGDRLMACVDTVRSGVSIHRTHALPPRLTRDERQYVILNSVTELERLASQARPLAARPDVSQNGIWIVPVEDVHSVEFSALETLDEMLRCASSLGGARALTDGETLVLDRISYFLRSDHEEVSYRTVLVLCALCRHRCPAVDATLRLHPDLMASLELLAAPEHASPERIHRLVVQVLRHLGTTTAGSPATWAEDVDILTAPGYTRYAPPAALVPPLGNVRDANMALHVQNQHLLQENAMLRRRLM
eukprot:TRINITY_DN49421_c0_g1_i1.p1 TRINITY_DN49421_c0_g1~~TRINITY_DN49421_c0_g1_i1.p1  ORF type:complete len:306 (-),score=50.04 TRINITY_DN49421_c0_g1_i1:261-1178(-)